MPVKNSAFIRTTPGSQSLERGLFILRAFRQGIYVLTNAELAARVGLPRPTVSRLTRSLVDCGFLLYDSQERGYRLAPVCSSLALAYRDTEKALKLAQPAMRQLAEGRRVNVGLAMTDQLEMVYLDTVRRSNLGIFRHLSPGSRIPIGLTSLGCAYLSGMEPESQQALLNRLRTSLPAQWPEVSQLVPKTQQEIDAKGYCFAQWTAGMGAVATPIRVYGSLYAMNASFPVGTFVPAETISLHGKYLLDLKATLQELMAHEARG